MKKENFISHRPNKFIIPDLRITNLGEARTDNFGNLLKKDYRPKFEGTDSVDVIYPLIAKKFFAKDGRKTSETYVARIDHKTVAGEQYFDYEEFLMENEEGNCENWGVYSVYKDQAIEVAYCMEDEEFYSRCIIKGEEKLFISHNFNEVIREAKEAIFAQWNSVCRRGNNWK